MRVTRKAIVSPVLLLGALGLVGCGSATTNKGPPVPEIAFRSAAIHGSTIPVAYTCDGKNVSPPLEWGAVPAGTGELALFIVGIVPEPATSSYTIAVEWAVAGLSPTLHRIAAGKLPPGAHVGLSSDGERRYSICPHKGIDQQYQFELYALPKSVNVVSDFAGMPILSSLTSHQNSVRPTGHGAFAVTYARKQT